MSSPRSRRGYEVLSCEPSQESAELPWLVTKPWRVFAEGGSYEEDALCLCTS